MATFCHCARLRTGSYQLWVGNRFSTGFEPDEVSSARARRFVSALCATRKLFHTHINEPSCSLSSLHLSLPRKLPTLLSLN
eukprot:SAG11_NODE_660_length_7893_cov_4.055042_1_plen_81_part_00